MDTEKVINELADILIDDWYSTLNWHESKLTSLWVEILTPELSTQMIKTFEATCFHVIQQLMYGEAGKEIIEKIIQTRGDIDVK